MSGYEFVFLGAGFALAMAWSGRWLDVLIGVAFALGAGWSATRWRS